MEVVSNMIPQALVVYIYNENWNNTTLLFIVKKINGDVASNDGYIYYRCRICAVELCIYVDQLNYTLSLSFGKAVVYTSEYALHFIDCNLFVKLFIDRAPWIQIRLSLRLQRDSQPVWQSL